MSKDTLKVALLEGEQIQWSGRSENLRLLDNVYRMPLIIRWVICALVALGLSIGYAIHCENTGVKLEVMFMAAIILIPLYIMLAPVLTYSKIKKNTAYAVTNMRAIVSHGETKVQSMEFSEIDALYIDEGENGVGTLRIGSLVSEAKPGKYRNLAAYGKTKGDEANKKNGMVFYNCPNLNQAHEMLSALTSE